MWKQLGNKILLSVFETAFSIVMRPFAKADSLNSYSTRGYLLLGLILSTPTLVLWWNGFLSAPLSQSHPLVQGVYKAIAERSIVLKNIPDAYVSIVFIPAILYVLLFLWSSKRQLIGELAANFCFWALEKVIGLGEWCIEHRWPSFFLIIFLSFILALLVGQEIRESSNDRRLQNDFEYWLSDVGEFVAYNPVTKSEQARYLRVKSYWREDFRGLLQHPDGSIHPAVCLNEMLSDLYSDQPPKSWYDVLALKIDRLKSDIAKCSPGSIKRTEVSEVKVRTLMNIFMGRIHVRLAENPDNWTSSSYDELLKGLEYFQNAEDLSVVGSAEMRPYKADAMNGKGTVYVNAFTAYLRRNELTSDQLVNLKRICPNPSQCAIQALNAYDEAGKDFEKCSFQGKRRLNNIADLLLRIGQHYDEVSKDLSAQPFANWTRTPITLADEIEHRTQDLMTCNSAEPFLSTFALTAAQAFGVSAKLKLFAGRDAAPEISATGHYLRLANSFEPLNVPQWEYSYFCFAVTEGELDPKFHNAVSSTFDGLPDAEPLLEIVKKKCR